MSIIPCSTFFSAKTCLTYRVNLVPRTQRNGQSGSTRYAFSSSSPYPSYILASITDRQSVYTLTHFTSQYPHTTFQLGRPINFQTFSANYRVVTPERHWETVVVNAEFMMREVLPAAGKKASKPISSVLYVIDLKGVLFIHYFNFVWCFLYLRFCILFFVLRCLTLSVISLCLALQSHIARPFNATLVPICMQSLF
jgi:hypothetical protein